jgi:hypothetical protein
MKNLTSNDFPAAFAAMDEAARKFWAYPNTRWQINFLHTYANETNDTELAAALAKWEE